MQILKASAAIILLVSIFWRPEDRGPILKSITADSLLHHIKILASDGGGDLIGKPVEYGLHKRSEYTTRDYHKVTDEVKPD
jgi:hypothetical protein